VSATLKQTGRSISKFVHGVAQAVLAGGPEPRLLQ